MPQALIEYNGFTFSDRSNYRVREEYVYDDSGRTVKATRFVLSVDTIICGNGGATDYTDASFHAATNMHRARQLLSKPGGKLNIRHDGFGPNWEINGYTLRDISWGPKPRIIQWTPIGHTTSVQVQWECEFEIAVCDGSRPPALQGVSQFNYSVSFSYDHRGYTTRRIMGTIEIAMTRIAQNSTTLVDSVDRYKPLIVFSKPNNFMRTTDWTVSSDKRSASFTIIDTEIASPNAYPPHVVSIQATHRVSQSMSALTKVANTISATIELNATTPKVQAWLIFRDLFNQRTSFVSGNNTVFVESLDVVEEIYENRASFQVQYYFLEDGNFNAFFSQTGIFQPITFQSNDPWAQWAAYHKHLTAHTASGGDYGASQLQHEWRNERVIDLCHQDSFGVSPATSPGRFAGPIFPPIYNTPYQNASPPPSRSYLRYEATIQVQDNQLSTASVTLGPNDFEERVFDPNRPDLGMPIQTRGDIKRFIEDNARIDEIIVEGYAERVGYPVPKPGRLRIGGQLFTPVGRGQFVWQLDGIFYGQPKYSAAWKQRYRLSTALPFFNPDDGQQGVK